MFNFNACMLRQVCHVTGSGHGICQGLGKEHIIQRNHDLEVQIEEAIQPKMVGFSDMKIFEKVGGKAIWVAFYDNMEVTTEEISEHWNSNFQLLELLKSGAFSQPFM